MILGWKFPTTNGGSESGHNDTGISMFAGNKISSLAREIIQNSLDAKSVAPVKVVFKILELPIDQFPEGEEGEFLSIFNRCIERCEMTSEEGLDFYKNGATILGEGPIQFLQISDYNTTGLTDEDDLWTKLVKTHGRSGKKETAGGSYGIGKFAPYAVSDLRTVFYSTMYDNTCKSQGRSILITHENNEGRKTQGIGYYGEYSDDSCDQIPSDNIPEFLIRQKPGTTLSIAGFNADKDWKNQVAAAVVTNFFVAIEKGELQVSIEGMEEINGESLQKHFEKLSKLPSGILLAKNKKDIRTAQQMYKAFKDGTERDIELNLLGHCKLKILVAKNLPKEVGIVRNTGMLITKELDGLKSFAGFEDFVAICTCDSKKGNTLLRRMENPEHDKFQPERLNNERKTGEKALDDLAKEVRSRIKKLAASDESDSESIDELLPFFSTLDSDLGDTSDAEPEFEKKLKITKKPKYRSVEWGIEPTPPPDIPQPTDEMRPIDLHKIRIIKDQKAHGVYKVSFVPTESGKISLYFRIAGDQQGEKLALKPDCLNRAKNVEVKKGERAYFTMESIEDIKSAFLVDAYAPK